MNAKNLAMGLQNEKGDINLGYEHAGSFQTRVEKLKIHLSISQNIL